MHNITINVKQNSYKYLIDMLSNIKDASVIEDNIIEDTSSDIYLLKKQKKTQKILKILMRC